MISRALEKRACCHEGTQSDPKWRVYCINESENVRGCTVQFSTLCGDKCQDTDLKKQGNYKY